MVAGRTGRISRQRTISALSTVTAAASAAVTATAAETGSPESAGDRDPAQTPCQRERRGEATAQADGEQHADPRGDGEHGHGPCHGGAAGGRDPGKHEGGCGVGDGCDADPPEIEAERAVDHESLVPRRGGGGVRPGAASRRPAPRRAPRSPRGSPRSARPGSRGSQGVGGAADAASTTIPVPSLARYRCAATAAPEEGRAAAARRRRRPRWRTPARRARRASHSSNRAPSATSATGVPMMVLDPTNDTAVASTALSSTVDRRLRRTGSRPLRPRAGRGRDRALGCHGDSVRRGEERSARDHQLGSGGAAPPVRTSRPYPLSPTYTPNSDLHRSAVPPRPRQGGRRPTEW